MLKKIIKESKLSLAKEQKATVYKSLNGRRYLTKFGATRASIKVVYRKVYGDCTCSEGSPIGPGEWQHDCVWCEDELSAWGLGRAEKRIRRYARIVIRASEALNANA